jgi:Holliday junction resolvasome RuvABC DNA-binding subunit
MAGPDVVGFALSVDMRALRSQLATVPGITKEAATAMVKELRDSYKAAEKSARDFAGNTENNMKRVTASTGAARAGVANLGNQFADIAIQLESTWACGPPSEWPSLGPPEGARTRP